MITKPILILSTSIFHIMMGHLHLHCMLQVLKSSQQKLCKLGDPIMNTEERHAKLAENNFYWVLQDLEM